MKDTYNRVVLTVIALALVALVGQNATRNQGEGLNLISAAHAADSGHRALFVPNSKEGFAVLQNQLTKSTPVMMEFGRFDNKDGLMLIYR